MVPRKARKKTESCASRHPTSGSDKSHRQPPWDFSAGEQILFRVFSGHSVAMIPVRWSEPDPELRFPRRENVWRLCKQWKPCLECRCVCLSIRNGQSGPISGFGASCHIAELDQNLRCDMQDLTSSVQFQNCSGSSGVLPVRCVCQSHQDAGIDQDCHYSYSPSLLNAASENDTPQSLAESSSPCSHSSWGWTGREGA